MAQKFGVSVSAEAEREIENILASEKQREERVKHGYPEKLPAFYDPETAISRLGELHSYLENFPNGCMENCVRHEIAYLEAIAQNG